MSKLNETLGTVEELRTSHDEWTMTGEEEEVAAEVAVEAEAEAEEEEQAMCNE